MKYYGKEFSINDFLECVIIEELSELALLRNKRLDPAGNIVIKVS